MYPTSRHVAGDDAPCSVMVHRTFAEDDLLRRVRSEFREMPGMRLTLDQAMRLWMLDRQTCTSVLDRLIGMGFLEMDVNHRYQKAHCGY